MHIGIDARLYGIYHRGIGRYSEQLILGLAKLKDNNRYTLFMRADQAKEVDFDKGKFSVVIADAPHYSAREHLIMPWLIRKAKVDIMHFPHLNVPLWCSVPYVVTIHDLIVRHFPDTRATNLPNWKYRIKVFLYNFVLKNAVKHACKIIAVSEFTKRDIVRYLGIDEKKIEVIYLGVDKMLLYTESMQNTPQFTQVLREKFKIKKQYLLYVGSAYPHKNLEKLIDAYKIIRTQYLRHWQLVLVGREDEFYSRLKEYIDRAVDDDVLKQDIIFTGQVSDKDLDGLYRGAKLFVFPSLYEGFGLPPLEAQSRAIAVACSRVSSLPEVLGDSAYYFDPKDIKAMAVAIDKAAGFHGINNELSRRGLERARQFSWERMSQGTANIYNSLFG
ncbi:glycosyltransferase family 4 protein [Patescibacteria group bacterium]|nr:glycosyltransferase family 4 protein [Patescibacteria group bacterium]